MTNTVSRIVQVIPELRIGGAERVAVDLAIGLRRRGLHSAVVSLFNSEDSPLGRELRAADIPVTFLGKKIGVDLRPLAALFRYFSSFQPDVVHSHLRTLPYTFVPAGLAGVLVKVHTVHNLAHFDATRVLRYFNHAAFRQSVTPVAVSHAVWSSMNATYGQGDYPCILNGIHLQAYAAPRVSRELWRAAMGFHDEIVFVSVGRLAAQKNHHLLLRAFSRVPHRCPAARLLLAGDGALRNDLEEYAQHLGIAARVRFLGKRNDIPDILHGSDVFVQASDWEGHPLAVIEALAARLPVIATDVGGVGEILNHEVNGLLLPSGAEEAIASAMTDLALHPERRREFARLAPISVQGFSLDSMVENYLGLYERCLQRTTSGRLSALTGEGNSNHAAYN